MHRRVIHIFITLIICGMFNIATVNAQTQNDIWNVPRTGGETITEPSPEATAMRRYQDCPVSYATGTADISIPLIELQSGDLGISLGLSYHTGGIKKSDIATGAGLGWTLTGLGSISRQINGFPDEWRGYGNDVEFDLRTTTITVDYLRSIVEAKTDAQYDRYNYNFEGYSGSFYIVNGAVVEYPKSELDISYTKDGNNIARFTIYTPEGKVYTFEEKEYIEAKSYSTAISQPLIDRDYTAVSQWNLTRIESLATKESISISYTPRQEWTRIAAKMMSGYSFNYTFAVNQFTASETSPAGLNLDEQTKFRNHCLPSVISSSSGKIEFSSRSVANSTYIDAPSDYLSSIRLKDLNGNVIKEVTIDNAGTFLDKRQKLSGIEIRTDGVLTDSYRFGYNDRTDAPGEDFFGYPNGKGSYMSFDYSAITNNLKLSPYRSSDAAYIADNCLTEITSITGLKTSIEYEPATVYITPRFTESVFDGNTTVGLRVRSIEVTDIITGRTRKRSYEYQQPISSVPLGDLKFGDFISQSGTHTFYNTGDALHPSTYAMGVTFTSSATLKGTPAESARLYYGKVIERLTGTDIDHALITEYEYDLSDVTSTLIASGGSFPYKQENFGNNPQDAKCLTSFHDFYTGLTAEQILLKEYYPSRGYLSQTIGGGPLLKRRTEKEWTASGYRTAATEESFYSKTDQKRFTDALYCESAVFRYDVPNSPGATLNITDYTDVNYFISEILSYRTVCDSTVKTTYYPGGESRRVKTRYINSVNSAKGGRFPGFYADSVIANSGVAYSPLGVVVSCGSESIATYTALTENVNTERNYNVYMAGMRKLPVLEKWVTQTAGGRDSVLRQTDYGFFGSKSIVRPERVTVSTAQSVANLRALISEQRYTAYDSRGHINAMTDAQGRSVTAEWDADYGLLTKTTLPAAGLSTTYTHIPLIGCSSITSPSGKKRQFDYVGGRLATEKNTAGNVVASYGYSLYGETAAGNGRNLITSTVHDDSGEATESTLYDGFGLAVRKLSTVAGGSQVCATVQYDAIDRPVRQYLPVPSSDIEDETDGATYYKDAFPYKSIIYRNLRTDQPLEVLAEGQLMQGHPTKTEYLCNNTKDAALRCPRYLLSDNAGSETITSLGYYPAGALDVTRTTDPDGHTALVFTDWRGFKILERRVMTASTFADTHYLYDPLGRVRVIIQPEGTARMTSGTTWNNSSAVLSKTAFIYRYDSRGNCICSLVPGGGPVKMKYDAFNRLAFRCTAAMDDDAQTEYYLYDRIGRQVVAGLADIDFAAIDRTYAMTATFSPSASGIDGSGYTADDQALGALIAGSKVTTANYYDNYSAANLKGFADLPQDIVTQNDAGGLLTAQRQAVFSHDNNGGVKTDCQCTLFGYDSEERQTTALSSSVVTGTYSVITKEYSRLGHVINERSSVVFSDGTYTLSVAYTRDALGNTAKATASLTDAKGSYRQRGQSKIEYDYDDLGRMSRMSLYPLTSDYCSYDYNMRGQIRSISSKGFSQRLYYEDGESPVYNGNISASQFGYLADGTGGDAVLTDRVTYAYDALNRLISSVSTDGYNTAYVYDLNSAPVIVTRSGLLSDGVSVGTVDDLRLLYDGNRPVRVQDRADRVILESSLDFDAPDGEAVYGYDSSGRLVSDSGSDIYSIVYAPNDMPVAMLSSSADIEYRYRADGVKLSTSVTQYLGNGLHSPIKTRYDIGPFRFLGSNFGASPTVERIELPWGYLDKSGQPNVYIKDYQGNVRAVYNQYSRKITQQNDYYPYGLPKAKSTGAEVNPFKYGGKELTTDMRTPFYDFEARVQLPTLGLFGRPDPKAGDFQWLNTYSYCGADPVNRVDPDGEWSIEVHLNKNREVNGYGTAVLLDRNKEELFHFTVRAEGIGGHNRMKEDADTPLGVYNIPQRAWIIPDSKTSKKDRAQYGQYPRLIMEGESGEIVKSGRSLIRIHGGRQEIYNEQKQQWEEIENPELEKTRGCIRAYDIDMRCLKAIVDEIETIDKNEKPEKVIVIDDLEEYRKLKDQEVR